MSPEGDAEVQDASPQIEGEGAVQTAHLPLQFMESCQTTTGEAYAPGIESPFDVELLVLSNSMLLDGDDDGDGTPNRADLDDDNDGIPDGSDEDHPWLHSQRDHRYRLHD